MLRSFMSSSMRCRSGVSCWVVMETSCRRDCRNPAILAGGGRSSTGRSNQRETLKVGKVIIALNRSAVLGERLAGLGPLEEQDRTYPKMHRPHGPSRCRVSRFRLPREVSRYRPDGGRARGESRVVRVTAATLTDRAAA